ncbi:MAG: hypothetical protein ABIQ74_12435 [Chitinophagales bacterium]
MKGIFLSIISPVIFLFIFPSQSCNENVNANSEINSGTSNSKTGNIETLMPGDQFKNYWYAGKAEICSYTLEQARYGEIHAGTAVTIFVTEDFSKSRQVKLDQPESSGSDRLPVLKLNLVKKFNTGIYPYSVMLSVFSPVDILSFPHAVKECASVQEWCGMTYSQLNSRNNKNEVKGFSYFEDEGDDHTSFPLCWLEDEIWNLIRLAPEKLPSGDQTVLPGLLYTRLTHIPMQPQTARFSLKEENEEMSYTMDVASQKHRLIIKFEKDFPYKITGWEETFPGFDGKLLTTTAKLTHTIMTDYWLHHNDADRVMREELGLPKDSQ